MRFPIPRVPSCRPSNGATARRRAAPIDNIRPRLQPFRLKGGTDWTSQMPELDFRAPRLFVDAPLSPGQSGALERNQSNYLGNGLRLSAGESILVFNGRDGAWQGHSAGRQRADSRALTA